MKFACCSFCATCNDRMCHDEGEGRRCDCGADLCPDCACPNECEETSA